MPSLTEVKEEIQSLQYQMHKIFEEAGQDLDFSKVRCVEGSEADKLAKLNQIQTALTEKGAERDRLELARVQLTANEKGYQAGQNPVNAPPFVVTNADEVARGYWSQRAVNLRKAIEEAPGWRQFVESKGRNGAIHLEFPEAIDFKALVTIATMTPQAARQPIQQMGFETRTVIDAIGTSQATSNALDYYEETTIINAALTVDEGVAKPEATAAWTLRTVPIIKVAVWIPVTSEALEDVPFLESQIRGRLAFDVERVEEEQVLVGTGTAGPPAQIRGVVNASGIQTQAKGADPTPDAFYRAMQKVRGASGSGFLEPDLIVMHPNDWTDVKLLRTAAGEYIWGPPSAEGPDRLWGLQVRQTTAMTENTGLTGAFAAAAEVYRRAGITITASSEHSTYFTENKVAILAESRLGLAIWRPTGFCTVTGI